MEHKFSQTSLKESWASNFFSVIMKTRRAPFVLWTSGSNGLGTSLELQSLSYCQDHWVMLAWMGTAEIAAEWGWAGAGGALLPLIVSPERDGLWGHRDFIITTAFSTEENAWLRRNVTRFVLHGYQKLRTFWESEQWMCHRRAECGVILWTLNSQTSLSKLLEECEML